MNKNRRALGGGDDKMIENIIQSTTGFVFTSSAEVLARIYPRDYRDTISKRGGGVVA
jgi:hypothetical protein